MRSSFGSITKLGDGRWQVQWPDGYKPDGKRRRRTKVIRGSRKDAELFLAAKRLESGAPVSSMTLADYAESSYFPGLHVAPKTLQTYMKAWEKWLKPLLGCYVMDDMTPRLIEDRLWEIPTRGAQRNVYALLRQILNDAYASCAISDNPTWRRIRLRPKDKAAKPSYSLADLDTIKDGIRGMRSEPYVLLCLFGGLRREEACALWCDDIERGDGIIYVDVNKTLQRIDGRDVEGRTKTVESTRIVPIAGYAAERIIEIIGIGHVSLERKESRTNPDTVGKRWRYECEKAGLPYVPMKDLRASFASIQSELGTSLAITSRMMGHTVMQTNYAHYQRAQLDAFTDAARRMGDA